MVRAHVLSRQIDGTNGVTRLFFLLISI